MAYRIVLTDNAREDFDALDARKRATVREAMRVHLTHEPTKQSKSRIKRLRELRHPQFRLRVEDIRVFYDVIDMNVVIIGSCSQIVDMRNLDWSAKLIAIHKETDDGVMHEYRFRETNSFARQTLDAGS